MNEMKPGDIVVYRERAACITDDKIKRATYQDEARHGLIVVSRDGFGMYVSRSDIIRVEPSQHGWPWR